MVDKPFKDSDSFGSAKNYQDDEDMKKNFMNDSMLARIPESETNDYIRGLEFEFDEVKGLVY